MKLIFLSLMCACLTCCATPDRNKKRSDTPLLDIGEQQQPAPALIRRAGKENDVKIRQKPCPDGEMIYTPTEEKKAGSTLEVGFEKTVGDPKPTKIYTTYRCKKR
jgi:hypothetical protein